MKLELKVGSQGGAAYLLRILAELDAHPLTVLGRGIQHQFFRRRPSGPATHQIQEPIAVVPPGRKGRTPLAR
jgi:hypothetical protein